ncbi:MAG: biotin/lipoyl-binding protein, partial [Comamonas sp.]
MTFSPSPLCAVGGAPTSFSLVRKPLQRHGRVLTVVVAAALLVGCGKETGQPPAQSAPAQVGVVVLQKQSQQIDTQLPGRTSAFLSAEVRPQVSGIVQKRLFTEGALVKQGQPLYEIDAASLRAAE